jgi:hypothetical protein
MGLINYKDIDFNKSINKELKTFDFNGSEIAVVPYLSINDKYDLVMITLQKSLEKGIYNHVKLDMYFDLHLVYMYTNIQIDTEDRADEAELYDTLKRSGLLDKVIAQIDEKEIETLYSYIYEMEDIIMKYRNTFGTVVSNFIETLPENMEKAKDFIESFDQEKINNINALAKIFTNTAPVSVKDEE